MQAKCDAIRARPVAMNTTDVAVGGEEERRNNGSPWCVGGVGVESGPLSTQAGAQCGRKAGTDTTGLDEIDAHGIEAG